MTPYDEVIAGAFPSRVAIERRRGIVRQIERASEDHTFDPDDLPACANELRAGLVDLAGECLAWIEAIDKRGGWA